MDCLWTRQLHWAKVRPQQRSAACCACCSLASSTLAALFWMHSLRLSAQLRAAFSFPAFFCCSSTHRNVQNPLWCFCCLQLVIRDAHCSLESVYACAFHLVSTWALFQWTRMLNRWHSEMVTNLVRTLLHLLKLCGRSLTVTWMSKIVPCGCLNPNVFKRV